MTIDVNSGKGCRELIPQTWIYPNNFFLRFLKACCKIFCVKYTVIIIKLIINVKNFFYLTMLQKRAYKFGNHTYV